MSLLSRATRGPEVRPLRMLIHGVPKVGKSSLLAGAPSPYFLDAEQGTKDLDVLRLNVTSWGVFEEALIALLKEPHDLQSVVLDTLDSLERHLCNYLVAMDPKADSVEGIGGGFGKGWQRCAEEWAKVGNLLAEIQSSRGMHVFAIAHSEVSTFSDPSGSDHSQWSMRLHKKSLAFWRGWVDDILFATRHVATEYKSRKPDQKRSGRRFLVTKWRPGIEAGCRSPLPDELDLSWTALEKALRESGRMVDAKPAEDPTAKAWSGVDDAIAELAELGAGCQADRARVWLAGDNSHTVGTLLGAANKLRKTARAIRECATEHAHWTVTDSGEKCEACPLERAADEPPPEDDPPAESMAAAMDVQESDIPF